MRQHGYPGKIIPVNPELTEALGEKCYPDLDAVPEPRFFGPQAAARNNVLNKIRRFMVFPMTMTNARKRPPKTDVTCRFCLGITMEKGCALYT